MKHKADQGEAAKLLKTHEFRCGSPVTQSQISDVLSKIVFLNDHETLVYDSGGRCPPLVLLHALSLNQQMWKEIIPLLTPHYRVIAYDLRGFGRAADAPSPTGVADFCNDLNNLLNYLGLHKASIVGLSLGGVVAQFFALQYPERVETLGVLASTAWSNPFFNARAEAAEKEGMHALVAPTLSRWFTSTSLDQNGWGIDYAKECIENTRVTSWAAGWRALTGIDFSGRLSEIISPAFVLAGEDDPSTPVEMMQKIATALRTKLEIIPSASHMLTLEKPLETGAAILRGLGKASNTIHS